ncbi:hypothetical protein D6817_00440, partial [Candidatus Pacearchaeota archaeon]
MRFQIIEARLFIASKIVLRGRVAHLIITRAQVCFVGRCAARAKQVAEGRAFVSMQAMSTNNLYNSLLKFCNGLEGARWSGRVCRGKA